MSDTAVGVVATNDDDEKFFSTKLASFCPKGNQLLGASCEMLRDVLLRTWLLSTAAGFASGNGMSCTIRV